METLTDDALSRVFRFVAELMRPHCSMTPQRDRILDAAVLPRVCQRWRRLCCDATARQRELPAYFGLAHCDATARQRELPAYFGVAYFGRRDYKNDGNNWPALLATTLCIDSTCARMEVAHCVGVQSALHDAIGAAEPNTAAVICAPRRTGKSTATVNEALWTTLRRGATNVVLVVPELEHMARAMDRINAIVALQLPPCCVRYKAMRRLELRNRSRLTVMLGREWQQERGSADVWILDDPFRGDSLPFNLYKDDYLNVFCRWGFRSQMVIVTSRKDDAPGRRFLDFIRLSRPSEVITVPAPTTFAGVGIGQTTATYDICKYDDIRLTAKLALALETCFKLGCIVPRYDALDDGGAVRLFDQQEQERARKRRRVEATE
ncbi:hypothetical protein LCGC14_1400920 [marine sediment metagenome]|uniref:Uncharacterized protein n=1 Tax=marine sediment metagenome TaxID=412755 RepID=A0A0F9MCP8_9ZZZZ